MGTRTPVSVNLDIRLRVIWVDVLDDWAVESNKFLAGISRMSQFDLDKNKAFLVKDYCIGLAKIEILCPVAVFDPRTSKKVRITGRKSITDAPLVTKTAFITSLFGFGKKLFRESGRPVEQKRFRDLVKHRLLEKERSYQSTCLECRSNKRGPSL